MSIKNLKQSNIKDPEMSKNLSVPSLKSPIKGCKKLPLLSPMEEKIDDILNKVEFRNYELGNPILKNPIPLDQEIKHLEKVQALRNENESMIISNEEPNITDLLKQK